MYYVSIGTEILRAITHFRCYIVIRQHVRSIYLIFKDAEPKITYEVFFYYNNPLFIVERRLIFLILWVDMALTRRLVDYIRILSITRPFQDVMQHDVGSSFLSPWHASTECKKSMEIG